MTLIAAYKRVYRATEEALRGSVQFEPLPDTNCGTNPTSTLGNAAGGCSQLMLRCAEFWKTDSQYPRPRFQAQGDAFDHQPSA